jgi:hypothetical protein
MPPLPEITDAPRFFIDHGMIHDRLTGKHVSTEVIEYDEGKFDTSPVDDACALLNSLASHTASNNQDALPQGVDVRRLLEKLRARDRAWENCLNYARQRVAEATDKADRAARQEHYDDLLAMGRLYGEAADAIAALSAIGTKSEPASGDDAKCHICNGRGVYDAGDGDGRVFEFECCVCNGTGRATNTEPTVGVSEL